MSTFANITAKIENVQAKLPNNLTLRTGHSHAFLIFSNQGAQYVVWLVWFIFMAAVNTIVFWRFMVS